MYRYGGGWKAAALYSTLGILSGVGLLGKVKLLDQVVHFPAPLSTCLIVAGLAMPLLWRFLLRYRFAIAILSGAGLLIATLVVYPRVVALHAVGHGSDQADCIIAGSQRMTSLLWPYKRSLMWSGNPMSCGPGWIMLQSAFTRWMGYRFDLLLLWAGSLFCIDRAIGRERAIALVALLALCPGVWQCAANGSDFLTFGIVIAAFLLLTTRSRLNRPLLVAIAALIFQFRAPIPAMAGFLRRSAGRGAAIFAGLLAIFTQLAFLVWNPLDYIRDGPLHVIHKALGISPPIGRVGEAIVLVTAALIAGLCLCLWIGKLAGTLEGSLGYLVLIFAIPAITDIFSKFREYSALIPALGNWEGGPWMTACLPLAAVLIAVDLSSKNLATD